MILSELAFKGYFQVSYVHHEKKTLECHYYLCSPHPSPKGIETAINSGKTKLTARHHHVCDWGPAVVLAINKVVE